MSFWDNLCLLGFDGYTGVFGETMFERSNECGLLSILHFLLLRLVPTAKRDFSGVFPIVDDKQRREYKSKCRGFLEGLNLEIKASTLNMARGKQAEDLIYQVTMLAIKKRVDGVENRLLEQKWFMDACEEVNDEKEMIDKFCNELEEENHLYRSQLLVSQSTTDSLINDPVEFDFSQFKLGDEKENFVVTNLDDLLNSSGVQVCEEEPELKSLVLLIQEMKKIHLGSFRKKKLELC